MKQKHEKTCPFAPCSCPLAGCNFEGSSKQLCGHFSNEHRYSATRFHYERLVAITVGVNENFLILREETDELRLREVPLDYNPSQRALQNELIATFIRVSPGSRSVLLHFQEAQDGPLSEAL
ncbi:hypothetical protein CRYUN_Cryun23aG0019600 [Craigia yunnanensis]